MSNIKPSLWIVNELESLIMNNNVVNFLDLACGKGRHSIYLASRNMQVVSIDIKFDDLKTFSNYNNVKTICFDLENEYKWPLKKQFDVVLVINYLYRKNFTKILQLVKPNGYLIYETFAFGNEKYGSPKNPKFLPEKEELKKFINKKEFKIIKYYHGLVTKPVHSIKQRCVAKKLPHEMGQ